MLCSAEHLFVKCDKGREAMAKGHRKKVRGDGRGSNAGRLQGIASISQNLEECTPARAV